VAIIDHGQIEAEGTPDELKREVSGDVVTVGLNGATPQAADLLDTQEFVNKLETNESGVRLYVDEGATAIPLIMRALNGAGHHFEVHRAAPAEPRRRVPGQDRSFLEGELT
jgi:ABC-2 type transport system ATP-binding protein